MKVLKTLSLWLVLLIFSLSLTIFAVSVVVSGTVADRDKVIEYVSDDQIYENFRDVVGDIEIETTTESGDSALLSDDSVIKDAAIATFTTDKLKGWTTSIVGAVFEWLEGGDPEVLVIDKTAEVYEFAGNITTSLEASYQALPECQTIAEAEATADNPLEATCRVPGVDISAYTDDIALGISESLGGEEDSDGLVTVNAQSIESWLDDNMDKSNNVEDVDTDDFKAADIPDLYSALKLLPVASLLVAILSGVTAIFLADTRRKGARKLGYRLIASSIVGLLFSVALSLILKAASKFNPTNTDGEIAKGVIFPIMDSLVSDIIVYSVVVAVFFMAVGVILLIALRSNRGEKDTADTNLSGETTDQRQAESDKLASDGDKTVSEESSVASADSSSSKGKDAAATKTKSTSEPKTKK